MPPELIVPWPDDELADSWLDILRSADHPRQDEAMRVLRGFKQSLKARWANDDQELADRLAWSAFFAGNYRRIVELAAE